MELVLATHNLHKVREIREMLKNLKNIDILSLVNFPEYQLPEETGSSFKENSAIKAEHAAKQLKKWVLADDSGLVVPSLDGMPGVYSKRYAGDDSTDAENRTKLLQELSGIQDLQRSAYFECCLTLANQEGVKKTVSGIVEGLIVEEEKGNHGFGYDSIFMKNDYDKTFGELDDHTKNRISHRRKALDKLLTTLEALTT